ncbi:MAG TPA: HlyD family efflux transporter periplasmic adaptor subunit [Candidatus Acidoferrales bacterium]|jgi:HlyD family secretion protein
MADEKIMNSSAEPNKPANTPNGGAPATPAPAPRRRFIRILVVAAILVVAGIFIWREFFAAPKIPDSIVVLSGRVEGDDSAIAPKTTGRILELRVREGDAVKAGDIIAILDDEQVRARENQARAVLTEAEAKERSASDQIAVLREQMSQNQLQTEQSRIDAGGRVRQAEADLAAAEADLAQQQAAYQIAAFNKDAYGKLAKSGAVSEQQGLQYAATADQQAAAVTAAKRRVESSQGALTTARANLDNPGIRKSQVDLVGKQITEQSAEMANARATTEQARAELAEAEANRADLIVKAPFDGTVATRAAEPGEVVVAGTALITLIDLSKVYLRGFVPEGEIGKVKVGQSARIYLDSNPKQPLDAYVSRIDPQATFTPENTYFRDDRVKQVVGLKLQLKSGIGFAKPGMPADGEILVQGDTWPKVGRIQ